MAKVVPLSDARSRLSELLDEIESRHEHVVITRNGRDVAVMFASAEYEALVETVEILEDEETLAALRESEKDVESGRLHALSKVRRELGLG
jgi:antitoxin YefM